MPLRRTANHNYLLQYRAHLERKKKSLQKGFSNFSTRSLFLPKWLARSLYPVVEDQLALESLQGIDVYRSTYDELVIQDQKLTFLDVLLERQINYFIMGDYKKSLTIKQFNERKRSVLVTDRNHSKFSYLIRSHYDIFQELTREYLHDTDAVEKEVNEEHLDEKSDSDTALRTEIFKKYKFGFMIQDLNLWNNEEEISKYMEKYRIDSSPLESFVYYSLLFDKMCFSDVADAVSEEALLDRLEQIREEEGEDKYKALIAEEPQKLGELEVILEIAGTTGVFQTHYKTEIERAHKLELKDTVERLEKKANQVMNAIHKYFGASTRVIEQLKRRKMQDQMIYFEKLENDKNKHQGDFERQMRHLDTFLEQCNISPSKKKITSLHEVTSIEDIVALKEFYRQEHRENAFFSIGAEEFWRANRVVYNYYKLLSEELEENEKNEARMQHKHDIEETFEKIAQECQRVDEQRYLQFKEIALKNKIYRLDRYWKENMMSSQSLVRKYSLERLYMQILEEKNNNTLLETIKGNIKRNFKVTDKLWEQETQKFRDYGDKMTYIENIVEAEYDLKENCEVSWQFGLLNQLRLYVFVEDLYKDLKEYKYKKRVVLQGENEIDHIIDKFETHPILKRSDTIIQTYKNYLYCLDDRHILLGELVEFTGHAEKFLSILKSNALLQEEINSNYGNRAITRLEKFNSMVTKHFPKSYELEQERLKKYLHYVQFLNLPRIKINKLQEHYIKKSRGEITHLLRTNKGAAKNFANCVQLLEDKITKSEAKTDKKMRILEAKTAEEQVNCVYQYLDSCAHYASQIYNISTFRVIQRLHEQIEQDNTYAQDIHKLIYIGALFDEYSTNDTKDAFSTLLELTSARYTGSEEKCYANLLADIKYNFTNTQQTEEFVDHVYNWCYNDLNHISVGGYENYVSMCILLVQQDIMGNMLTETVDNDKLECVSAIRDIYVNKFPEGGKKSSKLYEVFYKCAKNQKRTASNKAI